MPAKVTYATDLVLAAAIAANRINCGEYKKFDDYDQIYNESTRQMESNPNKKHRANRAIVAEALTKPELITQADHDGVEALRRHFHGLVAKIFTETITDFERKMLTIAESTEITLSELGIAAFMPVHYVRESAKSVAKDRLLDCAREYLAPITEKIQATIDIISANHSIQYDCLFISAITDNNHRVFFAYSGNTTLSVGSKYAIKATVKRHDENWSTVLGRVKPTKI